MTAGFSLSEKPAVIDRRYRGHPSQSASHRASGFGRIWKCAAKGFVASGTLEITEIEIILDGKLPLIARPFEPRIKNTIEREAAAMFA